MDISIALNTDMLAGMDLGRRFFEMVLWRWILLDVLATNTECVIGNYCESWFGVHWTIFIDYQMPPFPSKFRKVVGTIGWMRPCCCFEENRRQEVCLLP